MTKKGTTRSDALEVEGWVRQFTVDAHRADEYVELYKSMGNEVRLEAMSPEVVDDEVCATCLLSECDKYLVIYTRPRAATADG